MREAQAAEWLRKLSTDRRRNVVLASFGFEGIPILGTGEISLNAPITILSGPNGVGKTTLLRAVWGTLRPEEAKATILQSGKLSTGSSTATGTLNGVEFRGHVEYGLDELRVLEAAEAPVVYIDAARETARHQTELCDAGGADAITNGIGKRDLDAAALAELNYVLNRDYRSAALYEAGTDGSIPFFEVAYGEDRYDSRTMGSGEIAAFYIWWRLNSINEGTLVLIEEPEAFLSHGSQQALTHHLAATCIKKRLTLIISSHSSPLLSAVPKDSICYLSRGPGGMLVVKQPPLLFLRSLGVLPPTRCTIFVEDEAGRAFAKAILERTDMALSRQIILEKRNGESEISKATEMFSTLSNATKFVGLYDGDMRERLSEKHKKSAAFLPGNVAVEILLREMINVNPGPLRDATGVGELDAILSGIQGAEVHDWYEGLAKELGLNKGELFRILVGIWFQSEVNQSAALETYNSILQIINDQDGANQG